MSVGAICFTSSGSNGGCWVVLVFPRLFFLEQGFFFSIHDFQQKTFPSKKKKRDLRQKKKLRDLLQKKNKTATYAYFHNRATLSSTIREIRQLLHQGIRATRATIRDPQ